MSCPLNNLVPLPWLSGHLQTRLPVLAEEEPLGLPVIPRLLFSPQEPVTTRSRTQKGERAQRLWHSISFQTWRTRTQTRTWMKMRMRMRRARTSRPRRHPCPAHRPRCQQTLHLFRALSPQMPPLATRPCRAAQSQKPSTWQLAVVPSPAKASCASPTWDGPLRAPWRRTQAQP